jgi:Mg-chelatase subunit ChlD
MNEENSNIPISSELEARIVALVLGEASDFEAEELNRLITAIPELAEFRLQMVQIHESLKEVSQGDLETPESGWKLPTDRRRAVMATIRGETTTLAAGSQRGEADSAISSLNAARRHWGRRLTAIVSTVCLVGAIAAYSVFHSQRRTAAEFLASADNDSPQRQLPLGARYLNHAGSSSTDSFVSAPTVGDREQKSSSAMSSRLQKLNEGQVAANSSDRAEQFGLIAAAPESSLPGTTSGKPQDNGTTEERLSRPADEAIALQMQTDPNNNGMVKQSLPSPDYLNDDVQHFPAGPTFNLSIQNDAAGKLSEQRNRRALDSASTRVDEPATEHHLLFGDVDTPAAVEDAPVAVNRENMPQTFVTELLDKNRRDADGDTPGKELKAEIAAGKKSGGEKSDFEIDDSKRIKELSTTPRVPETPKDSPEVTSFDRQITSPGDLNETNAAAEAFSTFSLHVSDVSFKLAAAALARGEWPEASKIRIEEFVNALDYGDPLPGRIEKVACVVEQGIHPFLQQRNVLRISMRTSAAGRATSTPLNLTFLLDNSGSMERIDRRVRIRRAFELLAAQLSAIDQITLISFSRQPRLLAEKVSGTDSGKLVQLIEQLPSEGGTNIEAALQLAFEKAAAHRTPGAQNRIVLLTDGAVNLGNADPESLSRMVESMREAGIAFDAAGINADGLNDEVLEALTRKGDGRYYLLDSADDADDSFVQQIAGALRPSAGNVKVQVEFNPKRVGQYRLLGFEKHLLKQEDFLDDAVDAAEMASAEAGVALYQFEAKPDGEGDVGSVSVRFRDLSTGQMVENRWPIPYEPDAARPDQATPSLRIATTAALLAAKLKGEALGESVDLQTLSQLTDGLPSQIQSQTRVQQLRLMIEQARQLSAK